MAQLSIKAGATSQSTNVFIRNSGSTTGGMLTGVAASSLTGVYSFTGANAGAVQITLTGLATVTSAYTSGGWYEISSSLAPGEYRFDIPNSALATGMGRMVSLYFYGNANMAPDPVHIELTGWDNQDAVHGGMSCLPNTAVTTNGSLLTAGTGSAQLNTDGSGDVYSLPNLTTVYNGMVWVDTTNGVSGTTNYVNGVQSKPSSSLVSGASIASSLGIKRFQFLPESASSLTQNYRDYYFGGENYTVYFNSEDISGCTFFNATVSGTATASSAAPFINQCQINTATIPACDVINSQILGTITLASGGGSFNFQNCCSIGTAVFDLGASHSAITLRLRSWQGAVTLKHVFTGDTVAVDGYGQITIDATCTGGTIGIHGTSDLVNNGSGVTLSQVARISTDQTLYLPGNVGQVNGTAISSASGGVIDVNVKNVGGSVSAGAAGYMAPDWGHVNAPTTTVGLTNTTIGAVSGNGGSSNVTQWLGTAVQAASGGIPDVNVKNVGGSVSVGIAGYMAPDWSHVTGQATVVNLANTSIGNVTGTSGSSNVNVVQWNGVSVSSASGGIPDVNVKNIGGALSAGSAGYAAPDWAHVTGQATTVNLTNTSIGNVTGTSGSSNVNVVQWLGTAVQAASGGIPDVNVKNIGGAASQGIAGYAAPDWSHISGYASTVSLPNTTIGAVSGVVGSVGTVTNIVSGGAINTSGGAVSNVATVQTLSGNTPQSGDAYAVVNSNTYGNSQIYAHLTGLFTTALSESYAANNVAPTPAQIWFMIYSAVQNFSISGTTLTNNELNGSTPWSTVTLGVNASGAPISRTRAT